MLKLVPINMLIKKKKLGGNGPPSPYLAPSLAVSKHVFIRDVIFAKINRKSIDTICYRRSRVKEDSHSSENPS